MLFVHQEALSKLFVMKMRRCTKYLILSGTPVVLLMSCTIFYFNDQHLGVLADSRLRGLYSRLSGIQVVKLGRKAGRTSDQGGNKATLKGQESWLGRSHSFHHVNTASTKASSVGCTTAGVEKTAPVLNGKVESVKVVNLRVSMEDNLLQRSDKKSLHPNRMLPSVHTDGLVSIGHVNRSNRGRSDVRRAMGNHLHELLTTKLPSVRGYGTLSLKETSPQGSKVPGGQGSFRNFLLSHKCGNSLCTEFLVARDLLNFTLCKTRTEAVYSKMITVSKLKSTELADRLSDGQLLPSGECRFMNGSGRGPVGLISFPGSGNTWVRSLLQKATGICTGEWCCVQILLF